MKCKPRSMIFLVIFLVVITLIGSYLLVDYILNENLERRIDKELADKPRIVDLLTDEGLLLGVNGVDFWDEIDKVLNASQGSDPRKGYLPLPIAGEPSVWGDMFNEFWLLEVDGKLVGARLNLNPWFTRERIPDTELLCALVGRGPDTKADGYVWELPGVTITLKLLGIYPVLFGTGIPPAGITIISNEALGNRFIGYKNLEGPN